MITDRKREHEPTGFDVSCDKCPECEGVDMDSFSEMIQELKSRGWKIFKEGGEWIHLCPSCAEIRRLFDYFGN